jgi:hypothetical protein
MIREMSGLPEHMRRSITWDHGSELIEYERIQPALKRRCTSATPTHPGSAAPTRTPMDYRMIATRTPVQVIGATTAVPSPARDPLIQQSSDRSR